MSLEALAKLSRRVEFDSAPFNFSMILEGKSWIIRDDRMYLKDVAGLVNGISSGTWGFDIREAEKGSFEEMFAIAQKLCEFNDRCDAF